MAIYIGLFKVMQKIYFNTHILAAFVSNCVGRNLMLSFSSSLCNNSIFYSLQLLMTGVAVLKVDDLGRRPLLIGGVGGIVSFYFFVLFDLVLHITWKVPTHRLELSLAILLNMNTGNTSI